MELTIEVFILSFILSDLLFDTFNYVWIFPKIRSKQFIFTSSNFYDFDWNNS